MPSEEAIKFILGSAIGLVIYELANQPIEVVRRQSSRIAQAPFLSPFLPGGKGHSLGQRYGKRHTDS